MTTTQIIQTLTSPVAILIATAILGLIIQPWLKAHAKQVDAATASIQDSTLRSLAESAVRWLETDPAMAQLPGLVQRANGIKFLTQRTGLPEAAVSNALDAAYNALTATGQVVIAPKAPQAVTPAVPSLNDIATALLAQLKAAQPTVPQISPTAAPASPSTSTPVPAPTTQPAPALAPPAAPPAPTPPAEPAT